MGYKVPWNRLSEEQRRRRVVASVEVERRRSIEFKAQLAEAEAANQARELDYFNKDLIS